MNYNEKRKAIGPQLLFELDQVIMPFYMELGCPCSFPRFRHLMEFDYRNYDVSPIGCHESITLIRKYLLGNESCFSHIKDEQTSEIEATCATCSSTYNVEYKEFNLNFYLYIAKVIEDRAEQLGAEVMEGFPLVDGLFSLGKGEFDKIPYFIPAGLDAEGVQKFSKYMVELKAT